MAPKAGFKPGEELDPEKQERRRLKAERKEEKRLKKEQKEKRRTEHNARGDDEGDDSERRRDRGRSRSPPRERNKDALERPRSPPVGGSRFGSHRDYDMLDRQRERERDRRRWDDSARREQPGIVRWGRDK